jgi:hypothetical protein
MKASDCGGGGGGGGATATATATATAAAAADCPQMTQDYKWVETGVVRSICQGQIGRQKVDWVSIGITVVEYLSRKQRAPGQTTCIPRGCTTLRRAVCNNNGGIRLHIRSYGDEGR